MTAAPSGWGVDKAEISGTSARKALCPKRWDFLLLLLLRGNLPQKAEHGVILLISMMSYSPLEHRWWRRPSCSYIQVKMVDSREDSFIAEGRVPPHAMSVLRVSDDSLWWCREPTRGVIIWLTRMPVSCFVLFWEPLEIEMTSFNWKSIHWSLGWRRPAAKMGLLVIGRIEMSVSIILHGEGCANHHLMFGEENLQIYTETFFFGE